LKVLVTGSAGYLGSMLVLSVIGRFLSIKEFDIIYGDNILDIDKIKKAGEGIDKIIHLAAIVGLDAYDKNPSLAEKVNVEGTKNILSLGKPVIYSSVLGNYTEKIVTEDTPPSPTHSYFKSKLEAESLVLQDKRNIVLRFGSLYGKSPSMSWFLLVNNLVKSAVEDGKISLFQPDNIRPLTNIRDAYEAIIFFLILREDMLEKYGGIYNTVSINMSKRDIAEKIQKITQCRVEQSSMTDIESRNYFISNEKMRNLGFVFRPDLEKAIRDMIIGIKEHHWSH